MDRRRAPAAAALGDGDDPEELGVFTAERYFYGDDAPWCGRSASSLSSAFRTGTNEHDRSAPTPTAVTSSSEASWNSRSALLPNEAEKVVIAVAAAAAAAPVVEVEPEDGGRKPKPSSSSSSHLRRWLLGVAGCACAGRGDGDESVSSGEVEAGNVLGAGRKNRDTEEDALFPRTESQGIAAVEEAASARFRPRRWLDDGDKFAAGKEAFPPGQLPENGHRRAANTGDLSTPILMPEATATSDEKYLGMIRPVGGPHGSALVSTKQDSAFTIVAGNTEPSGASPGGAPGPGRRRGGRRDALEDEDDAALSEAGCAYPPSEASVVWSVVTADGAASGNFSSAASGYYYYFNDGEHDAIKSNNGRRRRSAITTSSSALLACMSEKAVDAVGPAPSSVHRPDVEPVAGARLGAAGGRRNGSGGGYRDVMRRP